MRSSYADLLLTKREVFRPGMSASVEIHTQNIEDATAIPIEAVTIRSKSDLDTLIDKTKKRNTTKVTEIKKDDEVEVVFICNNDNVSMRQVKTGIQDDKMIQIISGITVGDEIVTGPYSAISKTLKGGEKVKKVSKEELFDLKAEKKKNK